MFDVLISDDAHKRTHSSSNSLHSNLGLLLAPTVGSRVILCPQQCALSFLWEDRGPEAEYLKCVMRHMIVGKVIRETDTQFVVLFEIPDFFVSAIQCVRRAPRLQDDNKETKGVVNDDKRDQTTNNKSEEDCAFVWSQRPTTDASAYEENTRQLRLSSQYLHQCQKASTVAVPSISSPDETPNAAMKLGDCATIVGLPTVFGIVPVLSVSGEHASVLTTKGCDNWMQQLDENCNPNSRREWSSGKSHASESQHIPIRSQSHVGALHNRCHSTKNLGPVHVSFSITKRCCSSLLQNILEKHNKLLEFTSAVGRRDFTQATEAVLSVIHTYTEACGMDTDSLFLPSQSLVESSDRDDLYQGSIDWLSTLARTLHLACVKSCRTESPLLVPHHVSDTQRKSSTNQHLGILYALLSFIQLNDKQYQESLRDAIRALTLDTTCLEAYTRVIMSCTAHGYIQEAFTTASVALRCCSAVSPQFVRLSRSVHVYSYYGRLRSLNTRIGDNVDILPCTRHFQRLSEVESIFDKTHVGSTSCSSTVRTIYPYFYRLRQVSQSSAPVHLSTLHCTLPGSSQTMDYFLRSVRAHAMSAMGGGEVVFDEDISLLIVLPFKNFNHEMIIKHENDKEAYFKEFKYHSCCHYCAFPVMYKNEILAEVDFEKSKIMAERILSKFIPNEPVSCAGGCGANYCSEICRSRAMVEYHSMECDLPWRCGEEDSPDILNLSAEAALSSVLHSAASNVHEDEVITSDIVSLRRPSIRQLVDSHRARKKRFGTVELGSSSHANAIYEIRSVIKSFYSSITENSQSCYSRAVATALLVAGRSFSTLLSLFLPFPSAESIKSVLSRYVSQGFEPIDAHDAHGLFLAEEIFQQIGIPFFADTSYSKPLTVWEVLREKPYQRKNDNGSFFTDDVAHGISVDINYGFESLSRLLDQVHTIIQSYLKDEPVAFSSSEVSSVNSSSFNMSTAASVDPSSKNFYDSSSYNGNSASPLCTVKVWMADEEGAFLEPHGNSNHKRIHTWTFERLLMFLGMTRFTDQFWDFCLSSYAVMKNTNLFSESKSETFSGEENNEFNNFYRRHAVDIAIMAPVTCTVSDLTVFAGNAAYSRFFADFLTEPKRNPLDVCRNNSQSMAMLSINSHEPEDLRQSVQFGCGERKSSSSMTQYGSFRQTTNVNTTNLDGSILVEKPGSRRVLMRARHNIALGEELRFGNDDN